MEEEKLEFLKREEIRTMQKDIAQLRELEAQKERERIVDLTSGKKVTPQERGKEIVKEKEVAEELRKEEAQERKKGTEEEKLEERQRAEEERRKIAEEMEKRWEEEAVKREEEKKTKVLEKEAERQRTTQREGTIDKEIEGLSLKEQSISQEKNQRLAEIKKLETQLEPILNEETTIEKGMAEIEKLEKTASAKERGQTEKKRWEIGAKRREIEKTKWLVQEEIEKVEEKIKNINLRHQEVLKEKEELEKERGGILQKRQGEKLTQEKSRLETEITQLVQKKEIIKKRENELLTRRNKAEAELEKDLKEEKITEEVIQAIEIREEKAPLPKEQRKVEEERWKVEEDRKALERKKWELEQEKRNLSVELKKVAKEYQEILNKENPLRARMEEINRLLKIIPEEELKEKSELVKPVEEEKKGTFESVGEKTKEMWEGEEEEKRKFLERIQEKAKGEIPSPQSPPVEKTIVEKPVVARPTTEKETAATFIPKPPKRPSPAQKILVRTFVILLLFFVVSFSYWLFGIRKPEPPPPAPPLPPQEELEIPESLISIRDTQTLEISTLEELNSVLPQILAQDIETDGFTRILIKDVKNNKILDLKEFLEAFDVKTPEGLLEKLKSDFTLFIYSSQGVNRLGFVAAIKQAEGLTDLLSSWESTMEEDTEKFFKVLGKEGTALVPYFRQTSFKEAIFRFLTISKSDFGICYATFDDYFIFASSFESMKKTIEEIKAKKLALEEKIGQLFIIGFEGKTLTPQIEELFKKYRPGGVLLLSRNIESEEQLKKLTQDLQDLSLKETGLPLFVAIDQEGGIILRVNFAEEKTPQSEIKNPTEAYQIGLARGKELKELGINLNLAPVLDITSQADFLHNRSFQKSPEETGVLAKSLIEGQKTSGIFTAIKHFPGYGGISFNPESSLAELDNAPEINQFKKAMEAEPEFVMTSNVIYKNLDAVLPFTFSPTAIQFLKNNLGSEIIILTDDLAQNYLLKKLSLKDIVTKPIQAGADILSFSGWEIEVSEGLNAFLNAFKNREVSQVKIQEAISRIIKIKQNL